MTERSVVHSTFAIERTYDASPTRVWGAWAEPAAKASWFGPKDLPHESRDFDFRVGGQERFAVGTPDGATYLFDSRYSDIVSEQRIVYAYDMYRDETRISVSLATIELEPNGNGTKLTFTEQGAFLDGHDTPAEREHGTRALLDNLGQTLLGEASQ
jgi:uncharacterized protein YndB with AHSA1/START domain